MLRRPHYSTALAQAQGIVGFCQTLFELWQEGVAPNVLFEQVRHANLLNTDSERRLRNIVIEGFASRFLREPFLEAAPTLKLLLTESRNSAFKTQLILLYALRQHGIFFDFLVEEYWPAVRAGARSFRSSDVARLIDRGLVTGKLTVNWSDSVRERVSSYVLGITSDFGLLGKMPAGNRPIVHWSLEEGMALYLAYDLHFLGLSDDEVACSDEWSAFGLRREDVTLFLNRLQDRGHLIVQDTGALCRIEWKYTTRQELAHVLLS
jgi:hypothetical protein